MIKTVTDGNFAELVSSGQLMLIDFWAPWCQPCRMLGPTIEKLAERYEGRLVVGKCNVDDNMGAASAMRVSSIPAVYFFKDGKPVDLSVGLVPEEVLDEKIKALL